MLFFYSYLENGKNITFDYQVVLVHTIYVSLNN